MAGPIGNKTDQGFVFLSKRGRTIRETSPQLFILHKKLVHQTANLCDDRDVTPLIATANVVGFADAPALDTSSRPRQWSSTCDQSRTFLPSHKAVIFFR